MVVGDNFNLLVISLIIIVDIHDMGQYLHRR